MSNRAREVTCRVMEAMDEGLLNARDVADMALNWLSEADVAEMMRANDLLPYIMYNEDEDEDEDDTAAGTRVEQEWTDNINRW